MTGERTKNVIIRTAWVVPVAFYLATMSHTVGYVDAALVLRNAVFLELSAWVNNHNLFSLLGWIWVRLVPFGTEFFRLNLMSSLFGAFTVYVGFLACLDYTGKLIPSAVAAAALMMSHSLWWHSTMLEVYTLNTLLIALMVLALARYYARGRKVWLYASLLFWGLGISNHVLMGLFAPAFIVLVILERRRLTATDVAIGVGCFIAGLSLFLVAVATSWRQYGSLRDVLGMATGGDFRSLMFSSDAGLFWRVNYGALLIYQYPSLALMCIAIGLWRLVSRHSRMDIIILASIIPQAVWSANYFVWDMFAFSLPVYILLAFPLASGLAALTRHRILRAFTLASICIPLFLYPYAPGTRLVQDYVRRYDMFVTVGHAFDPAEYFLNPVKTGFSDVDSYVKALFDYLPVGASYFDNVHDYPIQYYYRDIRHERPDIECPITFTFWVTPRTVSSTVSAISLAMGRGRPVFLGPFVFAATGEHLAYSRAHPVVIRGQTIYRIE